MFLRSWFASMVRTLWTHARSPVPSAPDLVRVWRTLHTRAPWALRGFRVQLNVPEEGLDLFGKCDFDLGVVRAYGLDRSAAAVVVTALHEAVHLELDHGKHNRPFARRLVERSVRAGFLEASEVGIPKRVRADDILVFEIQVLTPAVERKLAPSTRQRARFRRGAPTTRVRARKLGPHPKET